VAASLDAFVAGARASVDAMLDRALPKPPACPPIVSEAVRYSVFAGGKRLRPLLTLAAADAVQRTDVGSANGDAAALAVPAACAIELIHTYSLIHDDLPAMDNDTLRRGRPTLHTVYGDGIAILAGDALQAEAFALLAREPNDDGPPVEHRKLRVIQLVAAAAGAGGMVGGQAIDLQAAGQVHGHAVQLDGNGLRAMHARKTGALIGAAATSGAIMAGASREVEQAVTSWAADIGLAFQIVDDLLDVEGTSRELGKSAGKDAAGNKVTYPALFGVDTSRGMARDCAARAHDILAGAGLLDGWLDELANWVINRKN
jgi:geranylgeranyl diphosphate synthase type II